MTADKYKGVVEIEILGEVRGFKFGLAAMATLCKLEGCSFAEVQQKISVMEPNTVINLFLSGAIQYKRLFKKEGPEPSYEEVANWVDNLSLEQNEEAVKTAFSTYSDPNSQAPTQAGQ